jgi:glycosyltransferase involved in cell wall biosynthesis
MSAYPSLSHQPERNKRIVLVGPSYPYRGGNALFMAYLYEALAEQFDVHFLNYTLLYPSLLFPGTTQYDTSEAPVKVVPNERVLSSINPLSWIRTARRINAIKPDLVVFDWWNPFFAPSHYAVSALLGSAYRGKILVIAENFISHEARAVDTFLTRVGLAKASCFLALSAIVERDLRSVAAGRPIYRSELPIFDAFASASQTRQELSENELHELKRSFGCAPDERVLLFFGYIRKYKGLDVLLNAMPAILRDHSKTRLLIAGEFYDDQAFYDKLIHDLGIGDAVTLIKGFIPNEKVKPLYDVADVLVQPYRSATQSGILNVAYGFGKPVIVTRVGGLEEFVEHGKTGFIVEPESPQAIAHAVKEFFERRNTTDFAAAIREKVRNNSFQRIATVFERIMTA